MISIGVDIGTFSIKIAEVESTSKSYAIRRIQEFPLSLDLTKDKKIEIIDTLRTLFSQIDREKTQFVFSLPQRSVSMRLVNFPFRERFKIQKAVAGLLEDDLPFSQEDAIFDTKIVRFSGKSADVLAMAVPKDRIADILNLAHDCGVEPTLVSAENLALANAFEQWQQPPPEVVPLTQDIPAPKNAEVVLNIGHQSSQLLIYAEGIMLSARSMDWGAQNIAEAIGAKYGLNYLQAMRELQLKGGVMLEKSQGTKEQVAFSQTIETALHSLIAMMRLKMLEAQSEFNLQWTKGSTIGGGSQLRNLNGFLTQAFEIPFNKVKQFDLHPPVTFETSPSLEAVTATAVGLAIEGLKRPRNPASNFLRGEFARQSQMFEMLWQRWGYTVQLGCAAFAILVVYSMMRESFAQRLVDESEQALRTQAAAVAGLKGAKAGQNNIRKFLSNVEKEAKNRQSAQKLTRLTSATDILQKISAAVPENTQTPLEIKRISIENKTAEVHGYAKSPADSQKILQALKKVAEDGRVQSITPRIKSPPGQVPFACKFKIQRFAGG